MTYFYDTITSGHRLAAALKNQGKMKEASKIFEEVYEGRKATLGDDHEDTLETLAMMK